VCTPGSSTGLPGGVVQFNDLVTLGTKYIAATNLGAYSYQSGTWQPVINLSTLSVGKAVLVGSNKILFGTQSGLFLSTDGGASAAIVPTLPAEPVTALTADGNLVSLNFQTSGFFYSGNAASTFTHQALPTGATTILSMVVSQGG